MMTKHLSAQLRAIIASAKIQLLIVAKRPMNIATGVITPWMFLSLFLIPRIGNLNQDQITHAISATITASFWAASIWSGARHHPPRKMDGHPRPHPLRAAQPHGRHPC